VSKTRFGAFAQQSCDVGIVICSHWFFIMRQQARSSAVISAPGAMHAIAGATQDTSSSRIVPSWRRAFTHLRIRFAWQRDKQRQLVVNPARHRREPSILIHIHPAKLL
jgi:hypothetical protein